MNLYDEPSKMDYFFRDWYNKLEYMNGDRLIEWWALFQFCFVTSWAAVFSTARYQFTGVMLELESY